MRLKLHTEHKMTKCFIINEKLLCYIYMYSVLLSNIRMNNFVSLRPQVLRKKKSLWFMIHIVAFLLSCSFSYAIHDRLHENQIWTREVLQLKLSSSCPRINSPNLFLRATLNSGHWNHVTNLRFEDRPLLTPVSWGILAHGAPVLFFRWGGHQFGIAEFSQGFSDGK